MKILTFKQRRTEKALERVLLKKARQKSTSDKKEDLLKFIEEEFDAYNNMENYHNVLNRKQRRALGIKKYRRTEGNQKIAKGFGSRKFNESRFLLKEKESFMKGLEYRL